MLMLGTMLAMMAAPAEDDEDFIQVEIRGTLRTGIVAIGGETTGTVITVKDVTWELDLGADPKFRELAKTLHNKKALITGTYTRSQGVERPREIVRVTSLKAADGP